MNGLPLFFAAQAETEADYERYLRRVVLKMGEDAQGVLLYLLPYLLGINIFIVNIDTSDKTNLIGDKYQIYKHTSVLSGGFKQIY